MRMSRTGIRTRPAPPAAATLWGDGFSEDGVIALASVGSWDRCSPDELVFPFPRLIARDGALPAALLAHLEAAASARGLRLAAAVQRARADAPDRAVPFWRRAGRSFRALRDDVARERLICDTLHAVLRDARDERQPARREGCATLVAFGAGLHPAYLWPETLGAPEHGITAAWLGHLDRGRPALMPLVVAEYVSDALGGGGATVEDVLLVELVGCPRRMDRVRDTAQRCLRGLDPVLRFGPRCDTRPAPRAHPPAARVHAETERP